MSSPCLRSACRRFKLNAKDAEATKLAHSQLAKAAALLRDLTYTAWVKSGEPAPQPGTMPNPTSPAN